MTAVSYIGDHMIVFRRGRWVYADSGAPVPPPESGSLCQGCGDVYRVDLIIPDHLWEQIKPDYAAPGGGLLCPACIGGRLEHAVGTHGVFRLTWAR
jgi:hypothetical protein